VLSHQVLNAAQRYPIQGVLTYDLAGIFHFSGRNYLPLSWSEDEAAKMASSCYTPQTAIEYFSGDCRFVYSRLREQGVWGSTLLWRAWFTGVTAEPLAYLQHRWAHFRYFMTSLEYVFHEGNDAADIEQHLRNPGFRLLRNYVFAADWLWMFRPGFWLGLAGVCILAAGFFEVPVRRFVMAVALSSLIYLGTYLLVGVGSNFRYAYWAVLAASAASVVLICAAATELWALSARWRSSRGGTERNEQSAAEAAAG
jgi:hypothetical protein